MKDTFYVILMMSFFLFSCNGGTDQSSGDNDEAVKTEQSDEITEEGDLTIQDCEDFLDHYDKWSDDYLKVVEAYMKDPTNIEVSTQYTELAQSAGTWYTDWTNYVNCASSDKYVKRFEEISDKIEKGLEKLGLGD